METLMKKLEELEKRVKELEDSLDGEPGSENAADRDRLDVVRELFEEAAQEVLELIVREYCRSNSLDFNNAADYARATMEVMKRSEYDRNQDSLKLKLFGNELDQIQTYLENQKKNPKREEKKQKYPQEVADLLAREAVMKLDRKFDSGTLNQKFHNAVGIVENRPDMSFQEIKKNFKDYF